MALLSDKQFLWLAGGAAVAVVVLGRLTKKRVGEVVRHVDPTDPGNIANRVHEWWWQKITGQEGGIGIWLADLINPPPKDLNGPVVPAPRYD